LSSRCEASWASGRAVVLSYPGGGNGKQRDMARAPRARDRPPPPPPSTSRLLLRLLLVVMAAAGDASLDLRQGPPQPCPPTYHPRPPAAGIAGIWAPNWGPRGGGGGGGSEREEDPAGPDRIKDWRVIDLLFPRFYFFRSADDEALFRFGGGREGGSRVGLSRKKIGALHKREGGRKPDRGHSGRQYITATQTYGALISASILFSPLFSFFIFVPIVMCRSVLLFSFSHAFVFLKKKDDGIAALASKEATKQFK
jgi:hypothetical protein